MKIHENERGNILLTWKKDKPGMTGVKVLSSPQVKKAFIGKPARHPVEAMKAH